MYFLLVIQYTNGDERVKNAVGCVSRQSTVQIHKPNGTTGLTEPDGTFNIVLM